MTRYRRRSALSQGMDRVLTSAPAITKVSDTIARGGEAKRAGTCKGVLFTGSGVPRNLPGFQLIADTNIAWRGVAWRVARWRDACAVPAHAENRQEREREREKEERGEGCPGPGTLSSTGSANKPLGYRGSTSSSRPSVRLSVCVRPS